MINRCSHRAHEADRSPIAASLLVGMPAGLGLGRSARVAAAAERPEARRLIASIATLALREEDDAASGVPPLPGAPAPGVARWVELGPAAEETMAGSFVCTMLDECDVLSGAAPLTTPSVFRTALARGARPLRNRGDARPRLNAPRHVVSIAGS